MVPAKIGVVRMRAKAMPDGSWEATVDVCDAETGRIFAGNVPCAIGKLRLDPAGAPV